MPYPAGAIAPPPTTAPTGGGIAAPTIPPGAANNIQPFRPGGGVQAPRVPTPANNIAPFHRGSSPAAPTPANNIKPFTRGGGLPSGAKPLPAVGAGAVGGAGAATAGVVVGGAAVGVGIGEGVRRGLVDRGYDGFRYPSNTGQLLADPFGTAAAAAGQYAQDAADWFSPKQDPRQQPTPGAAGSQQPGTAPPFVGGQEEGVRYTYSGSWTIYYGDGSTFSSTFRDRGGVYGPIIGPRPAIRFPGDVPALGSLQVVHHNSSGSIVRTSAGGTRASDAVLVVTSFTVARADGQPDTGGDPEPEPEPARAAPGISAPPALAPRPPLIPLTPSPTPAGAPAPPAVQPQTNPPTAPAGNPIASPGIAGAPGTAGTPSGNNTPSGARGPQGNRKPGSAPNSSGQTGGQPQNKPAPPPPCVPCCGGGGTQPSNQEGPEEGECTLQEVCEKLDEIIEGVGVKDFPLAHPLLTGESAGGQKNLVELVEWIAKNVDATNGKWPLDVKVLKADGKSKTVTVKDQADAFSELFGLSFTIAEDADAAVNIAARGVVETIQAKVATVQSGHWIRAIAKFLGFNTKAKKDKIKISVSPKASGANNKLENQEMADFLKPSEQLFESVEYNDSKELLIMLERILEDSEIARAALYKPLKQSRRGESNLTGEGIRREGTGSIDDLYAEEWEKVLASLRRKDIEFDEKKGDKQ